MDNERIIEQLLRRYAARRSAEAGGSLELRAFRRRQLQDEVIRRGRRSRHRHSSVWSQLLKFFAGAAVLAGVYLLVLRTSWTWSETDKQRVAHEDEAQVAQAPPPPLPQNSLGVMPADQSAALPFNVPEPAAPAAATAAKSGTALPQAAGERAEGLYAVNVTNTELGVPGEETAALPESFAAASPVQAEVSNTARFANNAPAREIRNQPAPAVSVLNRFRMELVGNELRVVDADGSTYSGTVQLAAAPPAPLASPAPAAVDRLSSGVAANKSTSTAENSPGCYTFLVTGTNLTLKQPVVFTGNLVSETNVPGAAMRLLFDISQSAPAQQSFPLLKNATVNGKAEVGQGTEVEINAAPVSQ